MLYTYVLQRTLGKFNKNGTKYSLVVILEQKNSKKKILYRLYFFVFDQLMLKFPRKYDLTRKTKPITLTHC